NLTSKSLFTEEHYVDPAAAGLTFPERKRNLIYILLESMETAYLSKEEGGDYPRNLLPGWTELADEHVNFSNTERYGGALQAPGTGWTVGGMIAQHMGLPLLIPIDVNSYGDRATFVPGGRALGDILDDAGYNQILMMGSDASFGGRGSLYRRHGDYVIKDYDTAAGDGIIEEGYRVWWGFEDRFLFEYAKQEIERCAEKDEPFNFTMLTADTHHPGGYVCPLCDDEFDEQYANVVACSGRQVASFVSWIRRQDFYENTTVVIAGDHLSMDNEFFEEFGSDPGYTRTTLNIIINSAVDPAPSSVKNRRFATFDLFPTTLAAMGVTWAGDRLSLGTNLFSGTPTLIEEFGFDTVSDEIQKRSDFYNHVLLGA
ncbi:MAG: LTA synthase family protein, partial [Clostridiales Family XIII bacterium]|nr:LTA synthase family protein [Clostridiales Family XIII bacterium]